MSAEENKTACLCGFRACTSRLIRAKKDGAPLHPDQFPDFDLDPDCPRAHRKCVRTNGVHQQKLSEDKQAQARTRSERAQLPQLPSKRKYDRQATTEGEELCKENSGLLSNLPASRQNVAESYCDDDPDAELAVPVVEAKCGQAGKTMRNDLLHRRGLEEKANDLRRELKVQTKLIKRRDEAAAALQMKINELEAEVKRVNELCEELQTTLSECANDTTYREAEVRFGERGYPEMLRLLAEAVMEDYVPEPAIFYAWLYKALQFWHCGQAMRKPGELPDKRGMKWDYPPDHPGGAPIVKRFAAFVDHISTAALDVIRGSPSAPNLPMPAESTLRDFRSASEDQAPARATPPRTGPAEPVLPPMDWVRRDRIADFYERCKQSGVPRCTFAFDSTEFPGKLREKVVGDHVVFLNDDEGLLCDCGQLLAVKQWCKQVLDPLVYLSNHHNAKDWPQRAAVSIPTAAAFLAEHAVPALSAKLARLTTKANNAARQYDNRQGLTAGGNGMGEDTDEFPNMDAYHHTQASQLKALVAAKVEVADLVSSSRRCVEYIADAESVSQPVSITLEVTEDGDVPISVDIAVVDDAEADEHQYRAAALT